MKWGLAMCILPTYLFIIRRQFPKLTRKIEFLILAEILSIPVLIILVFGGGGYGSLRWVPRLLSRIFNCELKYSGNLIRDENVIFIANHQSGMDVWPYLDCIPLHGTALAKHTLRWQLGPLSLVFQWLGLIFINRRDKVQCSNVLAQVETRLKNEKLFSILIFPEGTRGNGRTLLPFKLGAFRLALQSGVKIQPIVIGSYQNAVQTVPIKILDPIEMNKPNPNPTNQEADDLANHCRSLMSEAFDKLND